jgi:hypothetical protein
LRATWKRTASSDVLHQRGNLTTQHNRVSVIPLVVVARSLGMLVYFSHTL